MQEITAPLATLPDDPVPLVADVDFPVALRGYDRLAVDAYVRKTSQLVAELQATRSPDAAVRRALERVGEQISGILQRAHETAEEITLQSRREAEDRLEVARREAADIVSDAERRVKELDGDTDRIWAERHRIVDDTRGLAQELLALAHSAGERFGEADESEEFAEPEPGQEPELASPTPGAPGETPDPAPAPDPPAVEKPVGEPAPSGAEGPAVESPGPEDDPDIEATAVIPRVRGADSRDQNRGSFPGDATP